MPDESDIMLGMAGVLMGEQGFKKGEKFPFFSDRLCRTIPAIGCDDAAVFVRRKLLNTCTRAPSAGKEVVV